MSIRRIFMICYPSAVWVVCCATILAQPTEPPSTSGDQNPSTTAVPSHSAGVKQAALDTFYLIDENGKLVPYFDMPFEEFQEVYKLYKKINGPDQPRRYVLQSLTVKGTATDRQAVLDFTFTVLTLAEGWVRVPLHLNELILSEAIQDTKQREQFLEFQREGDGYVCWIRGAPNTTHTVKFQGVAPTRTSAGKTLLSLSAPTTPFSQLVLRVATKQAEAEVSGGADLQHVTPIDEEHTELTVLGLGRALEVAWYEKDRSREAPPPVHVIGNFLVQWLGDQSIRCDARLQLQSARTPMESFIVRLPPAMRLVPFKQPGYTVRALDTSQQEPAGNQDARLLVEVKLDNQTTGPLEVRLITELPRDLAATDTLFEIGGFDVTGTQFQSGHYHLAPSEGWSLQWSEGANVRRVENPADSLRHDGVVARFAYDRQPCSLRVGVSREQQDVTIEPQYLLFVERDQIRLEARLKCHLHRADRESIRIAMNDWIVDEQLVDADTIDRLDQGDDLTIHLKPTASSRIGAFDITLHAHHKLDDQTWQSGEFTVALPQPEANLRLPAQVAVFPADNVALTPDFNKTEGLVLESAVPPTPLLAGREPTFYFREPSDATTLRFVSRLELRKGTVASNVQTVLQFDERQLQVRQQLNFQIKFEPRQFLLIDVPESVLMSPGLEVLLNGKPLSKDEWSESDDAEIRPGFVRLRIELLSDFVGTCEVAVQHQQAVPVPAAGHTADLNVPLVIPASVTERSFADDRLQIETTTMLHVEPDDAQWAGDEQLATSPLQQVYRPAGDERVSDSIRLTISSRDSPKPHSTIVDYAWVQTWFTSRLRQERAVFRLTTSDDRIRLEIPRGARLDDLALDGQRMINHSKIDANKLTIDLLNADENRDYVVELGYSIARQRPLRGWLKVEMPRLLGAEWSKRFYWQLVLPGDEHLLSGPSDLTPELRWIWQGFYWGRQASLSQRDLEYLTTASNQVEVPRANNQYVFSSFGPIATLEFNTASRRNVLLVMSIAAFLGGMLFIYVPVSRHPAALLVLGLSLVAGVLLYPEPAVQVAQVASLGFVFVLVAHLLKRTLAHPRDGQALIRGTSRPGIDSTTDTRISPIDSISQGSTTTGSLLIHTTDPESRR